MRKRSGTVLSLFFLVATASSPIHAQQKGELKAEAEDFVKDILWHFLGPNWNLSLHGGAGTYGRFLLQQATEPGAQVGQRELDGGAGWNAGIGAGVDILLRMGVRFDYTFSSTDLRFDTDDGDGAKLLNQSDVGNLRTHVASFELMRYLLPAQAKFTPYATVGILGSWWVLDQQVDDVSPSGGHTQFRMGGLASVGMQGKIGGNWLVRLEALRASTRNPFTGEESFSVLSGAMLYEPTRVSKTDYRLALVYNFGRPALHRPAIDGEHVRR